MHEEIIIINTGTSRFLIGMISQVRNRMDQKGDEIQRKQKRREMVLAMSKVVLAMIAMIF